MKKVIYLFIILGSAAAQTQTDWVIQIKNKHLQDARYYNFPFQTPGGSLSTGTNTITLKPGPVGVASGVGYTLYISGGTGAAENVPVIGGSCTIKGGTSCTVIVTCANAHSGVWKIQSSTNGIQEAFNANGTNARVVIPPGISANNGTLKIPDTGTLFDWRRLPGTPGVSSMVDNHFRTGSGDGSADVAAIYGATPHMPYLFSTTSVPGEGGGSLFSSIAAYTRIEHAGVDGVALWGFCQVTVDNGSCWASNPIVGSKPGIKNAGLVGIELDFEPSIGSPPKNGSVAMYIDMFNEITDGFLFLSRATTGGLFSNGFNIGGLTEDAAAILPSPHPSPGYNIVGATNNGSGLCRISFNSLPHEINSGQQIIVTGITGAGACNGTFSVQRVSNNPQVYDLTGSSFSGTYINGGTATRKFDMSALINTTQGIYKSGDSILTGITGGIRFYNQGGNAFGRIYADPATGATVAKFNAIGFADLSALVPQNGMLVYCVDCTIASTCAGGGTGAMAKRLNGVFVCN